MDISIVLFLSLVVIVFLPPFGQRRARSLRKSSYATVQNWWCTFLTWTPSASKRHMNSSRQTTSQQQHLHRHCEEYKKKTKIHMTRKQKQCEDREEGQIERNRNKKKNKGKSRDIPFVLFTYAYYIYMNLLIPSTMSWRSYHVHRPIRRNIHRGSCSLLLSLQIIAFLAVARLYS